MSEPMDAKSILKQNFAQVLASCLLHGFTHEDFAEVNQKGVELCKSYQKEQKSDDKGN